MPIIYKLVGHSPHNKYYYIKNEVEGSINISFVHEEFIKYGISLSDIANIKFITDSETIRNPDKFYEVSKNEERHIFVFVSDNMVRPIVYNIFRTFGAESTDTKSDEEQEEEEEEVVDNHNKPITQVVVEEYNVSQEAMDRLNAKTKIILEDPDFITLLRIYKNKPQLFNTLSKMIQHGNVINELQNPSDMIVSDEMLAQYTEQATHLHIDVDMEIKIKALVKYKGNLSLALRDIMTSQI